MIAKLLQHKIVPWLVIGFVGILCVSVLIWVLLGLDQASIKRKLRVPSAVTQIDLQKPLTHAEFTDLIETLKNRDAVQQTEPASVNTDAKTPDILDNHQKIAESADDNKTKKEDIKQSGSKDQYAAAMNFPNTDRLEITPFGPLPLWQRGQVPAWRYYASQKEYTSKQQDNAKPRPKIAIIIESLGLNDRMTQQVINDLPEAVTLSFNTYAGGLDALLKKARLAGHEVLLTLPMEPKTYPQHDPGAKGLLKTFTASQLQDALHWHMGRASGYTGMIAWLGDRFTESPKLIKPILQDMRNRGVMFVDTSSDRGKATTAYLTNELRMPHVAVDISLDASKLGSDWQKMFKTAEKKAKKNGHVVVLVTPYPVTIAGVKQWIAGLDKKSIDLVPLSAIALDHKEEEGSEKKEDKGKKKDKKKDDDKH